MKNKNAVIGVALTLGALAVMSRFDSILSPSVALMQAAFPEADPSSVESIVSIGSSGGMIAGLISGFLLSRLSYKMVGALACGCVAVGGIVPIFVHTSVTELLVFAVIAGFGAGACSTLMASLAACFFKGEALQGVQGKLSAVQSIGSMAATWIGGMLAVHGWINNYYMYFAALVALALVLIYAPNDAAGESSSKSGVERKPIEGRKQSLPIVILVLFMGFLGCVLTSVLYTKLSRYLDVTGLGDSSLSGTMMIFRTCAAVAVGFCINPLKKIFKKMTMPMSFVLLACGAALFVFGRSLVTTAIGTFCIGFGTAMFMTFCPFILSNVTEQKHFPLVMGCFSCVTSMGFTVSPWFFRVITDVLGLDQVLGAFTVMIAIGLIAFAALTVTQFQKNVEKHYLYE